jgi:glyoxylase-like metal-dependent hydrolase (beta-lactamase superfamily II)/ferredoxin
MAHINKRVPENVPGEFFVDTTCIDCDTCRQLAPATFGETAAYAFVHTQPQTAENTRQALHALLACPTGSIGTIHRHNLNTVRPDFPLHIDDGVFYCGYNSPKSYGGNSYFVQHADGNWLIDAPKFLPPLVRQFETMGGLSRIFLTHRDDVADAARYARHFAAQRLIHRAELAAQPEAEIVLEGTEPVPFGVDFLVIPTPGHTQGHCVLLYKQRYLFSGDHLWWDRDTRQLDASQDYCWYSWSQQTASMAALARFAFTWVLPGHGQRISLPQEQMSDALRTLVQRMQQQGRHRAG